MTTTAAPHRVHASKSVWVLGTALGLLVFLALLGPHLQLPSPTAQDLSLRLMPPFSSWDHLLGTDHLGRDMLARLVAGTRMTMVIACSAVLVGCLFGSALGLIAGYRPGWADLVISRLIDAQLAVPFILLAMSIIVARGRSITVLVLVLAVVSWAQYARLVRAETRVLAARPFVLSLRSAGLPTRQIVFRHLLPNVGGTILVISTLEIGTMILGESALSFLGLGITDPNISWGAMLADGREYIRQAWWVVTLPGCAITALVLIVNLLGDSLRASYDPRKRIYR